MKTGQLVSLQDGKRVILLGICYDETLQQYRGEKEESAIFFCIQEEDFTPLKPINPLRFLMISSTLCCYVSNK